jgi:hypothetical protein
MSKVAIQGDVSGTGTFTIASPNSNSDRTLNLPDETGTVLTNNSIGYRYVQTVYFTANGTFTKATYPWLRAIRVKAVGAGGGGGGVGATGAGEFVASGGGGGGGYAEKFIDNIAGLSASETVTVGSGGAGGAAGINNGTAGGNSSFGAAVQGNGGAGGSGATPQTFWITTVGGAGGGGSVGDLIINGGYGGTSNPVNTNGGYAGRGGPSVLGMISQERAAWQSSAAGITGNLYGGGGSGAASGASNTAKAGGAGAAGIVIVELYA